MAEKQSSEVNLGGRPSKYREEYNEQAEKLCKLGSKDTDLADFFKVTEKTINIWKSQHDEFLQSIREGKEYWDGEAIENSLCKLALGYTVEEQKHEKGTTGEKTTITTRHVPASATAIAYWLNNRSRGRYKQKQEVELSGEGITFNVNYTLPNAN